MSKGDFNLGAPGDWDESVTPAVRSIADELTPVFYAELKRAAHRERARVGAGSTLLPIGLWSLARRASDA